MPEKPIASPSVRRGVSVSVRRKATVRTAAQSGAVELAMEAMPLVMWCSAMAMSVQGMAKLVMPRMPRRRAVRGRGGVRRRAVRASGRSVAAPRSVRRAATPSGVMPASSWTWMKRNDAPQMAERTKRVRRWRAGTGGGLLCRG